MKTTMRKIMSLLTFETPFDKQHISSQFAEIHQQHTKITPQWSCKATRQKLIAAYWFTCVVLHFCLLLGGAIFLSFLYTRNPGIFHPAPILASGAIGFIILMLFQYWPNFIAYFLPGLETAQEMYERGEKEQVEKCRKAQLSNLALSLVFYVFDRTSGTNALQSDDHSAMLLSRLFGVDRGSLKSNLELIMGHAGRRKNWTERRQTEIQNRFDEARQFLVDLNFDAGIPTLDGLEDKILRPRVAA